MTARKPNLALWFGPPLVFVAAVSYFLVFARFPVLRDFPWLNLPLVLAGMGLSAFGLWRAFAKPDVYRGKILGSMGLIVSLFLGGLFCSYIFYISSTLPEPTTVSMTLDELPALTLRDQDGNAVDLADYRGRKLLVVFYRGFW